MMSDVSLLRRALCLVLVTGLLAGACSDSGSGEDKAESGPSTTSAGPDAGALVLWVPGDGEPRTTGEGIGMVTTTQVEGGWVVQVEVTEPSYDVQVE